VSVENLREYARLCAADSVVREKAKAIGSNDVDGRIAQATALGLPWTHEDLNTFRKEQKLEGVLSDEDLGNIAGGCVRVNLEDGGYALRNDYRDFL